MPIIWCLYYTLISTENIFKFVNVVSRIVRFFHLDDKIVNLLLDRFDHVSQRVGRFVEWDLAFARKTKKASRLRLAFFVSIWEFSNGNVNFTFPLFGDNRCFGEICFFNICSFSFAVNYICVRKINVS